MLGGQSSRGGAAQLLQSCVYLSKLFGLGLCLSVLTCKMGRKLDLPVMVLRIQRDNVRGVLGAAPGTRQCSVSVGRCLPRHAASIPSV